MMSKKDLKGLRGWCHPKKKPGPNKTAHKLNHKAAKAELWITEFQQRHRVNLSQSPSLRIGGGG